MTGDPVPSGPGAIVDDGRGWIAPTTAFWQRLDPLQAWHGRLDPPWRFGVPVVLPDGCVLELPIRRLPTSPAGAASGPARVGDRAVASLIANQAALDVIDALVDSMTELARPLEADLVVGLPTLGLMFAPAVARGLGHARWVPLGTSRKFWYDEALSVAVSSITTPAPGKRLYLDPNQRPLLEGRRVLVVDDAISSARTVAAVWPLLEAVGASIAGVLVAMRQGGAWREGLGVARCGLVHGAFDSPLLELKGDGWWPM